MKEGVGRDSGSSSPAPIPPLLLLPLHPLQELPFRHLAPPPSPSYLRAMPTDRCVRFVGQSGSGRKQGPCAQPACIYLSPSRLGWQSPRLGAGNAVHRPVDLLGARHRAAAPPAKYTLLLCCLHANGAGFRRRSVRSWQLAENDTMLRQNRQPKVAPIGPLGVSRRMVASGPGTAPQGYRHFPRDPLVPSPAAIARLPCHTSRVVEGDPPTHARELLPGAKPG